MTSIIDALVYASIKNKLPSKPKGVDVAFTELDNVLNNTTIKRACCMKHKRNSTDTIPEYYTIPVRIPVTSSNIDEIVGLSVDEKVMAKKYGFIDKNVKVPSSMCSEDLKFASPTCKNFMNTYCENVKQDFKNIIGDTAVFRNDEFSNYKKDCGCYGVKPAYIQGDGNPNKCYMAGCGDNNVEVYPDDSSRGTECKNTICVAGISLEEAKAGGQISVSSNVTQNCGNTNVAQKTEEPNEEPNEEPKKEEPTSANLTEDQKYMIAGGCVCVIIIIVIIAIMFSK